MDKTFLDKIAAPGAEFRGAPFWAWNAELSPDELRRQIRVMKEMGLGGFFMHSRTGLGTPYLSPEWFDCVKACIDEAEKQNMLAWLYDEDRWPSGAGGGLVTKNEKYRMRGLALVFPDKEEESGKDGDYLALYAARIDGARFNHPRRIASLKDTLEPGETRLGFRVEVSRPSSWYNDQTYLDTMNEEAVAEFIKVTHQAYAREIGGSFGKSVPGIFTDEPNYIHVNIPYPTIPWTGCVPERFRAAYGYDLADHLPELFSYVDGKEFSKARLDYRNLVTELFVSAFSRQIGEWCGQNGIQSTGHMLCEDELSGQINVVGSAMRHYEFMQAPGIDLLTEHWLVYDTAKQCTSAAHQFGRERRLTETYGCTGWDFPFLGHKALGDWQYALGINYRCQHLYWYSMAAEAKRDYPAAISGQSPWYRQYPVVEDYFGRLGAALSQGEEVRDILVIHPIESAFASHVEIKWGDPQVVTLPEEEKNRRNRRLTDPRNALLKANLDFDYGDEELMSRHASLDGKLLRVGQGEYKAVLLPELLTIRATTLKLLEAFRRAGGVVAYLGKAPEYLGGTLSSLPAEAYRAFTPVTLETAAAALEKAGRRVSIATPDGKEIDPTLYLMRQGGGLSTLFVCNTSSPTGATHDMKVPLVRERLLEYPDTRIAWQADAGDKIFELELETGNIRPVASTFENGCHRFATSLPAIGSRLFFAAKENLANAPLQLPVKAERPVPFNPARWNIALDEANVLVFDHAAWAANGGALSQPEYIIKIDDALRAKLDKRPRGGAMVQPWVSHGAKPAKTLELVLEYTFDCDAVPAGPCHLGLERPDLYRITLNGKELAHKDCGFWCDPSLRKLGVPAGMIRKGTNTLRLESTYHELLPGLEMVYLLGAFGVHGNTITAQPETLAIGDWCPQGLQNYAGNVTYQTTLPYAGNGPLVLEIPEWRGVSLGIRVNGGQEQPLAWPPFRLNLAESLKPGDNTLEITVYGHRRNSHGPFYLNEKWPAWTGPGQFKTYEHLERQLVPCGLLTTPLLFA